jgi:hypothetical protein
MCPVIVNVAVPVGVPDPELPGATVAVKVTPWLSTEGLADEVTVVVDVSGVTAKFTELVELDVVKLVSALNVAETA